MSDIQPTKIDKEAIFDTIHMMCVAGEPRVARAEFGRYEAFVRAEAVKSEREKWHKRILDMAKLFNALPTGDVKEFDLLKIIREHLYALDSILTTDQVPFGSSNEWDALAKEDMWNEIQDIRKMIDADGTMSICSSIDAYATRREQEAREDERLKDATIVDEFLKTYYPEQRRRFGITLCAAIMQGTEPAKSGEDVERDIRTAKDYLMVDIPGTPIEIICALDRLVSRIKDGKRG